MVRFRGPESVRISKVKGHADDEMVRPGRVRAMDKVVNDLADRAADFGRRRVPQQVIDLRWRCAAACASWYPLVLELHWFFIAIARAAVNKDGHSGTALHPTVWSVGGTARERKVVQAVCGVRLGSWSSWSLAAWFGWLTSSCCYCCRCSVLAFSLWVLCLSFVPFWVIYTGFALWRILVLDASRMLSCFVLYERCAGERLVLEKTVPKDRRDGRPTSVSAVPDGPSIDIWRSCRYLGAVCRALGSLFGGLGRFLPCWIGAHHCRLTAIGWEQCGHRLTSRHLEVAHPAGRVQWQQAEGNKKRYQYCTDPIRTRNSLSQISLILHYRTMYEFRTISSSTFIILDVQSNYTPS